MAWKDYNFHFLDTVSKQLVDELKQLDVTQLDATSLSDLENFQGAINSTQGIYLLHLALEPVYLGKSGNVRERLSQHLNKLTGRKGINILDVGFKALLLDKSMSTAANEDILIAFFQKDYKGLWNNKGIGPKDPGKQRDTTRPSFFDRTYPVNEEFPVNLPGNQTTIGLLFKAMKQSLPYVFRYQKLPNNIANQPLDLTTVDRNAFSLLSHALGEFPAGWHAAIVGFGIVLYKGSKAYWHTAQVLVSPGSPPPLPGITEEDDDADN
ncbi:hypothetical protein [Xanthomonas nasturtii]|uniref:hypothetical protein n=1 Tax=Xanthomonas nasturtii TaxID=1843581 RepID=UPI0020138496|nr:hypothetical protein [Xanthomonas nasturtii]MCL1561532.1 hypothetical protein [Xanthomonas nasturtii]